MRVYLELLGRKIVIPAVGGGEFNFIHQSAFVRITAQLFFYLIIQIQAIWSNYGGEKLARGRTRGRALPNFRRNAQF